MKNNNSITQLNANTKSTSKLNYFIHEITTFIQRYTITNNYETSDNLLITFNDIHLLLQRTLKVYDSLSSFNDNSFLIETHLNFMTRIFKKGIQLLNITINDSKQLKANSSLNSSTNLKQRSINNDNKRKEIEERYKKDHSYHVKYQKTLTKKTQISNSNNSTVNISNISYSNLLINSVSSKDSNVFATGKLFTSSLKHKNRNGGIITQLNQINQQQQQQQKKRCKSMSRNEKEIVVTTMAVSEHSINNESNIKGIRSYSRDVLKETPFKAKSMNSKVVNLCTINGKRNVKKNTESEMVGKDIIFTYMNSKPSKCAHMLLEKGYDIIRKFERDGSLEDRNRRKWKSVH